MIDDKVSSKWRPAIRIGEILLGVLLSTLFCGSVLAASAGVVVSVVNAQGDPVADAVASLHPLDRPAPVPTAPPTAIMDQRGLSFVPLVLAVQTGTQVLFPNSDQVRHHVYSFSATKQFELKLYPRSETPHETFDHPGVDVLGCNIHDWMLGFIYIVDTPYFGKSGKSGIIRLSGIPAGRYELRLWHPFLEAQSAYLDTNIQLKAGELFRHRFEITLHAPDESNAPPAQLHIHDPGPREPVGSIDSRPRTRLAGHFPRSFSQNSYGHLPQMIDTSDSGWRMPGQSSQVRHAPGLNSGHVD